MSINVLREWVVDGRYNIEGVELYKQGFLLIQGAVYRIFTHYKANIPKRLKLDWNEDSQSLILSHSSSMKDEDLGFTDESVQPTNPKPRGRVRIKSVFNKKNLHWPSENEFKKERVDGGTRKISAIRIPFKVEPGRLELFIGSCYDNLGMTLRDY